MSAHGRPRGRQPSARRTAPPHVSDARRIRRLNRDERTRRLLHGKSPDDDATPLFPTTLGGEPVADAFGGLTCCYCDRDVSDPDARERTFDGRMRCHQPECHAAEERARTRAEEA